MREERWLQIKELIKGKFQLLEEKKLPLDGLPGEQEIISFVTPAGKFKLERVLKPKVLDKKTTYSQRIGSDVKVEYVYSENEFVDRLIAYQWNEARADWQEISPDMFGL